MTKPFSFEEAKKLKNYHLGIYNLLRQRQSVDRDLEAAIRSAVNNVLYEETLSVLRTIPIDEINRDHHSYRTNALKDYGFQNIEDVYLSSVQTLSSVYGVSQNAAYQIKQIAKDLFLQASMGTKIKLSYDSKTSASTMLVTQILKYNKALALAKASQRLLQTYGNDISRALEDFQPANNPVKWFFTSSEKKKRAIHGYEYLKQLAMSNYATRTEKLLTAFSNLDCVTSTEAWEDFRKYPIYYNNTLDRLTPGAVGSEDKFYGLPENLAMDIQDECFFPDGLLCELRRYQEWGVKYILHQKQVLLGDEMGLGKTVQAIATMVSLKNTGATHFVVVCPASVLTNWCREIKKHSKLRVTKVHGSNRQSSLHSWLKYGGVAVTTYETTKFFKLPAAFSIQLLVVDEAHYIKNPEAQRSKNVCSLRDASDRLLFMTGTALENRVDEMIALIHILRPDIANQLRGMESLSAAPRFRQIVAPVYYRRKREDVLTELPELIDKEDWCTLLPEEEFIYEQTVLEKKFAQARRVSWNIDNLKYSSKAQRLLEIIEEAKDDDRKIIVFSFFLDTIRKICQLLGNQCMPPINGSVSPEERQRIIDEFDSAPAGTVLAAQILAGGTGLNIQTASVVVICEPQFKPSIENQAISRAYRMGQSRNVLVHRLLCENTVDERISELLKSKQAIFDAFADESVAAKEAKEIDNNTFSNIIDEEIKRINEKHGSTTLNS